MKYRLASLILVAAATLSGCYYDPGYSYVRNSGYNGDVYYGDAAATGSYYAVPGYYGGYGCCYAPGVSLGIGGVWYGGPRYYGHRHYYSHRHYSCPPHYRGHGHQRAGRGHWQGGHGHRGGSHGHAGHGRHHH